MENYIYTYIKEPFRTKINQDFPVTFKLFLRNEFWILVQPIAVDY